MPWDSTRSRNFVNPSIDHCSSSLGEISPLQIWFTPNAEITFSTSSEELCWVPSFISAFLGAGLAGAAPPEAATPTPTRLVCKNFLRSNVTSLQSRILSRCAEPRQAPPRYLLETVRHWPLQG